MYYVPGTLQVFRSGYVHESSQGYETGVLQIRITNEIMPLLHRYLSLYEVQPGAI